jgi:hypothetical protein
MSFKAIKDPQADLDYTIDWSAWLGADTIATSSWSVADGSGLVAHDPSIDVSSQKATVWIRGGNSSTAAYAVTNHVKTVAGREDDRTIGFSVSQK